MAGAYRRLIQTVDSHTEGNSTRVITGGYAMPPGRTLVEKRAWLWRHDDGLRRMLNFEPRGHGMMCSVLLLPPIAESADFAVIIMEQDEYVPMCGHCIIGTAMTVVTAGMVAAIEPITTVRIETPAGLVRCEVEVAQGRIGAVSFETVDSFLLHRDARVTVEGLGALTVDVAYGGDFYVMADADPLGLRLAPDNDAELIAAAR
ncbi:MAG: proline racemase family protein, partial [Geminicoccaceae bacterium]